MYLKLHIWFTCIPTAIHTRNHSLIKPNTHEHASHTRTNRNQPNPPILYPFMICLWCLWWAPRIAASLTAQCNSRRLYRHGSTQQTQPASSRELTAFGFHNRPSVVLSNSPRNNGVVARSHVTTSSRRHYIYSTAATARPQNSLRPYNLFDRDRGCRRLSADCFALALYRLPLRPNIGFAFCIPTNCLYICVLKALCKNLSLLEEMTTWECFLYMHKNPCARFGRESRDVCTWVCTCVCMFARCYLRVCLCLRASPVGVESGPKHKCAASVATRSFE